MALQAVTTYSQFDPYSFQDRIAPYLLVDKAAGEVMDTIDELGSKAEALKKYADENPNSDYAKQYNQYMKDLDQIASDMSKYGMSATLRNNSRSLKRKYSSVVSPMEEADKLFREQQKERLAHPERVYLKGLSFNDAYNNKIDNTYLTEGDIAKETLLNYSSGFNTSYSKWMEQGATPEQALLASRLENVNTLDHMLKNLSKSGYNINDSRIQKAINTGILSVEADAAKGEMLTRKEREDIANNRASKALGWANHNWSKQKDLIELRIKAAKEGLDIDDNGNIISAPTNPFGEVDTGTTPGVYTVKSLYDLDSYLINTDTGSLKSGYFGNKNKLNNGIPTYVNPLEVYEEIEKVKKENPIDMTKIYDADGTVRYTENYKKTMDAQIQKMNEVKNKYGVTNVLSKDQYQILKDLGYTSKSTYSDFRNNLKTQINDSKQLDAATSLNLENYDQDLIETAFSNDRSRNKKLTNVVDYYTGKPISYRGLLVGDENKNEFAQVTGVQYNTSYPNEIIIQFKKTNSGTSVVRVPKDYLGLAYGNIIDSYLEQINQYTQDSKNPNKNKAVALRKLASIEKTIAMLLRAQMESKIKNATIKNNSVVNVG